MSSSNHHFLAILPLFAILSISPMQLDSKLDQGRTIASEVVSAHPKYEARAAKIDRTKIEIDKDLDLNCYQDRENALRKRIIEVRDGYKVSEVKKDAVSLQRIKIESLISSLVDLEEDMKALKAKEAFPKEDLKAEVAMTDFKVIVEGLLEDEKLNEELISKAEAPKEEETQVVTTKPEKPASEKDPLLCELEEKNKVLTKQVEELLEQQKTIMQTMLGMSSMMVQMNQQQQMLPPWMTSGSMMNYQQLYPSLPGMGNGQWVFYPQNIMPTVMGNMMGQGQSSEPNVHTTTPQLGNQAYQQAAQTPGLSYLPLPQPYLAPTMSMLPASFGAGPQNFANAGTSFNFGV